MRIKFNSNDGLPSNKMLKLRNMIIVIRSVFHEGNNYYLQVFLREPAPYPNVFCYRLNSMGAQTKCPNI